jgi:hypothetical protein
LRGTVFNLLFNLDTFSAWFLNPSCSIAFNSGTKDCHFIKISTGMRGAVKRHDSGYGVHMPQLSGCLGGPRFRGSNLTPFFTIVDVNKIGSKLYDF